MRAVQDANPGFVGGIMTSSIVVLGIGLMIMCGVVATPSYSAADEKAAQPAAEEKVEPKLTVALLQMLSVKDDQDANLKKADEYCRNAAKMGADIALMPEMWNIGYGEYPGTTREAADKWAQKAVSRDSEYVRHFASLAKELNMAIVLTYLEKWPKAPRNAATLIDRTGKQIFTYAKVHTCDFTKREAACTPGDGFHVGELDTAKGKINVGMMICYDREFPESARVLMLKGAELILTPNACLLDSLRIDEFKIRGYENAVGVAMTNYAIHHPGCNGNSVAFDEKGRQLVHAPGQEGIYTAEFNIPEIRQHQKNTIWGGAYRRPQQYKDVTKKSELPAFQRGNAFGEKFDASKR